MNPLLSPAARWWQRRQRFASLVALLIALAAQNAAAVMIVTTNGTNLYRFDSGTLNSIVTVQITGLQTNESLVGLDFRPATGQLFGIGSFNRVYRLDYMTGEATQIGASGVFDLDGTAFGTDFNPISDRIRLVSNTEQNIRINPDNPDDVADSPLSPAGNVVAIAYSNSYIGATNTTLYGIDSAAGTLVRIGGVNGTPAPTFGQVTTIGSLTLGTNLDPAIGFDIASDGTAYAAIRFNGLTRLYTINLSSGVATIVGTIGSGSNLYRGLAVGPSVFENQTEIRLPTPGGSIGVADVYPSTINVSGLTGRVTRLAVRINNLQHTSPNHLDMLLVSPSGEKMVIWSDVGGTTSTCTGQCNNSNISSSGLTIVVDDAAPLSLPTGASPGLASRRYRPANIDPTGADDFFAAPAPTPPYAQPAPEGNATLASAFNGIDPNGTWSLYIVDDEAGETGRLADGWGLEITDAPCTLTCRADINTIASPGQCGRNVVYLPSTTAGPCGEVTHSPPSGSFFPVGTTVVNVSTASGSTCSFNVTVADTQVPAITCNSDITVQAPAGKSSTVVEYPPATVADNCAGATAVYNPPSGSSFPVGTTTVTGTGTDASGNTMMCTFNVTVTAGGGGDPQPPASTKLANISTRLQVQTGNDVLIGGFIVTGAESKRLMVRAIGPSLPVEDRLADPLLQLFNGAGDLLVENNNWKEAANQQEIFDTTIAPADDRESAILVNSLTPGAYTAIVSGADGGTGIGLVEAYDLSVNSNSKLANIATRGLVQAGDRVMIGGFIVVGPNPQKLLVRAIGTSLPLENRLADPVLQLFDSNGEIVAQNDNWRSDQEADIAATGIPPNEDAESALLTTVAPAAYTAVVRGANDGTGVGLVEVYALD